MISTAQMEEATAWRRHLHANPELAFQEHQTSRFIAERLSAMGLKVTTGYAQTGVVGTLTRGTSRRAIGLRADMDALPMEETSSIPHRSKVPGVMHACGHDGHVAMLLAAARACAELPALDGTVHFIFQPAEEVEGGGREMVADGLFRDFPVDAVYSAHNWPALAVGSIVARDQAMMAAFGTFEITLTGRGSHGAMPHESADPMVAAGQLVMALQTITARNVSPLDCAVISVTQLHAGDSWNVIPEIVTLRGTTRWFEPHVADMIETRMRSLAHSIAEGFCCRAEVTYRRLYPATINDAAAAAFVRSVAGDRDIGLAVVDAAPSMASEDFAFMLEANPGCYFWLGSQRPGENPVLHSPQFDFNDEILPLGTRLWTGLVAAALRA